MDRVIKLEALIATPPTSKCQETIEVLEALVRRHPDELQLVVFKRGVDFVPPELRLEAPECGEDQAPKVASLQMRTLINKGSAVPICVIDGVLFSSFLVPNLEELDGKVQEILRRSVTN